jgi:DNA-binding response OmpR family regulator
MRLLLIGDDKKTALQIKAGLKSCYSIDLTFTAQEGEELLIENIYDAIIIDLADQLCQESDLCKSVREKGIKAPILIISNIGDIASKVNALDNGADDYITKPFSFLELEARLRALLRRHPHVETCVLTVADLTLDVAGRVVKRGDTTIKLRRKELAILEYLMRNTQRVVTRDMILNNIWDDPLESFHNTVDVHIKYLRDRIDRQFDKKLIKTVHGHGYKIES